MPACVRHTRSGSGPPPPPGNGHQATVRASPRGMAPPNTNISWSCTTGHRNVLGGTLGWGSGPFGRRFSRNKGQQTLGHPLVCRNVPCKIQFIPQTVPQTPQTSGSLCLHNLCVRIQMTIVPQHAPSLSRCKSWPHDNKGGGWGIRASGFRVKPGTIMIYVAGTQHAHTYAHLHSRKSGTTTIRRCQRGLNAPKDPTPPRNN